MAVFEEKTQSTSNSFKKTIEESAMPMVYDILQSYQYTKPISSSVREAVLNAIDSVHEKNIAKNILSGKNSISDYYLDLEGDVYESSKFKKDYYNLKHLSDNDDVVISYVNNSNITERDEFIIKDNGVGLGGERLEGFMSLSYSTKRASKEFAGKFGLGAKAPLSTGIESFRIVSIYNGYKFTFDIFSDSVQSITGKFSESGMNKKFEFSNGYIYYGEETLETNSVSIIIPVKKHNKRDFFNAVTTQLLYVKHPVRFYDITESSKREVKFKADIYEENNDIILSNQSVYSMPHVIINGTCYGYIDFEELELEAKSGPVGISVTSDEVDVSPSRESVLWTHKTKETISKKYESLEKFAIEKINEKTKGLDVLNTFKMYHAIQFGVGDTEKEKKLFKFVPMGKLSFCKDDINIAYTNYFSSVFDTLFIAKTTKLNSVYKQGKYTWSIAHSSQSSIVAGYDIYLRLGDYDQKISHYIAESVDAIDISINIKHKALEERLIEFFNRKITYEQLESSFKNFKITDEYIKELNGKKTKNITTLKVEQEILDRHIKCLPIVKLLIDVPRLDDFEIPAGWCPKKTISSANKSSSIDKKSERKANKEIPFNQITRSGKTMLGAIKLSEFEEGKTFYFLSGEELDVAKFYNDFIFLDVKVGRVSQVSAKTVGEKYHWKKMLSGYYESKNIKNLIGGFIRSRHDLSGGCARLLSEYGSKYSEVFNDYRADTSNIFNAYVSRIVFGQKYDDLEDKIKVLGADGFKPIEKEYLDLIDEYTKVASVLKTYQRLINIVYGWQTVSHQEKLLVVNIIKKELNELNG